MNKKIKNKIIGYFQNKKDGRVVCEATGTEYTDGSSSHSIYDGSKWVLIRTEKIPIKDYVKRSKNE